MSLEQFIHEGQQYGLSRRGAMMFAGLAAGAAIGGCTPVTPNVPTTQPVANPSAQNALNAIETVEALSMTSIAVAYNLNLIPATDYNAAVAADKLFQALATGVGADIAAGKPVTATDVGDALAAALATITAIHGKSAAAKSAARKASACCSVV